MSDLINRDELIKELEVHCIKVSGDVDSVIGQVYRMAYQHAIEVVKLYPPAYDVDKVVAELKEYQTKYESGFDKLTDELVFRVIENLISIVKKGRGEK